MGGLAIDISRLSFRYQGSRDWALEGVDLRIHEGEVVLITGPTGSGKSTLLRAINGLLPDFYEGEVRGSVRVHGKEVLSLRPNQVATTVGTVFQSPEDQALASKVRRDVAFGLENLGLEPDVIARRVRQALADVGLGGLEDREVTTLSGGQLQRLALASVLAMQPRVLLLDEPASELDPNGREQTLSVVQRVAREGTRTVALTDHRLADWLGMVDRVVVLHDGRVELDGRPEEVIARPELEGWGVEVPKFVRLWLRLSWPNHGAARSLSLEGLVQELADRRGKEVA